MRFKNDKQRKAVMSQLNQNKPRPHQPRRKTIGSNNAFPNSQITADTIKRYEADGWTNVKAKLEKSYPVEQSDGVRKRVDTTVITGIPPKEKSKRACKNCGRVHKNTPFVDCYSEEDDGTLPDDLGQAYRDRFGDE